VHFASPPLLQQPGAPTGLTATPIASGTSVQLNWTAASGSVDHYEISRYSPPAAQGTQTQRDLAVVGRTTATSFTDHGLNPTSWYSYAVVAVDSSGNRSNAATVTVNSAPLPSAPRNLRAVSGGRTVKLSWDPASSPLGINSYRIIRDGVAEPVGWPSSPATEVAPGGRHTYAVEAIDNYNRVGPPSNTVTVDITDGAGGGGEPGGDGGGNKGPGDGGANNQPNTRATCVVPQLKGMTVRRAKRALSHSHCGLGSVKRRHHRGRSGRVLAQSAKPGRHLRAGSKVSITLSR
jgi:hypothetical protein